MRVIGTTLWHTSGFASLCRAIVECLSPVLSRRGWGRPRLWRGFGILTIICSPLLSSFGAINADDVLYLRCNLNGTELSDGRSTPYSDTVVFKINLQTKEAWEVHPNGFRHYSMNHPRQMTADIDEHAIRLSRGDDSDVRSSDISYRIDRGDGSIVFSYRVTWYFDQVSDDSLTLAAGACEKASTIPAYVEHLSAGDLHHFF